MRLRRSIAQLSGPGLSALAAPQRAALTAGALAVGLTAFTSLLVVSGGAGIRLGAGLAAGLLLVTLARARPAIGAIATLVFLVFVATLRRMLLPAAPWMSGDPMLLVAPLVAALLIVKALAIDKRRLAPDAISILVLVVLAITCAEVVNPIGGGIAAGITGLMFMAVPLLWFFVGREFLRDADVERLLGIVVVLGVVVACYGLWQLQVGYPPWDLDWLALPGVNDYSSLNVGGALRGFGTFSSFGEYGLFLGSALVVAVWLCMNGKLVAAVPIPLLGVALFLSSGRQPLILSFLAIVVMAGLRTRRPATALVVTGLAVGAASVAVYFGNSLLSSTGEGSSNALVAHQLGGIANPLDPDSSTLFIHLHLFFEGIKSGVSHPFGQGTAVTNGAAGLVAGAATRDAGLGDAPTLGIGSLGTDVDVSNAFVAFGVLGGTLYLLLILAVLVRAARACLHGSVVLLPVVGILIVNAGQWANGGNYALAALIWMLVGVVAARSRRVTA